MDTNYNIGIKSYVSNLNVSNIRYYNCDARTGTLSDIDCENYKYWLYWYGTSTDNEKNAALKLTITWSYEEYEYSS